MTWDNRRFKNAGKIIPKGLQIGGILIACGIISMLLGMMHPLSYVAILQWMHFVIGIIFCIIGTGLALFLFYTVHIMKKERTKNEHNS